MGHSIAAKYAARPAARFVHPSARTRERRLGLGSRGSFRAATAQPTVLRRADPAPLARMRAVWRAIRPARLARAASGRPRPVVTMQWARSARPGAGRRPSAAPAPWLG